MDRGQPVDPDFSTATPSTISILETTTLGTNEDSPDAIRHAWEEVQKRLEMLAMENSWEIKTHLNIPDILQLLGEVDRRDQAAHNRHSEIKDRFDRTLQCVSTVGGLAASVASEVSRSQPLSSPDGNLTRSTRCFPLLKHASMR